MSAVANAANIFRTGAERILCQHQLSSAGTEVSDPLQMNNF